MDWQWVGWLLGIVLVTRLLPLLVALAMALRLRVRLPRWQPVTPSSDEGSRAEWLEEMAAPLLPLGFEPAGFVRERPILDGVDEVLQLQLRHPPTGTWATVSASPTPDARLPWRIDLETPLAGGGSLISLLALGHTILAPVPGVTLHDAACLTPEELWREHRERLAAAGPPRLLALDEFLGHQRALAMASLRQMGRTGVLRDAGDGTARIRFAPALAWVRRMVAGNAARERLLARRGAAIADGPLPATPVPAWAELDAFHAAQAARRRPLEPRANLAILLGSALAFAAAMSWLLGPLAGLALLAVVAFHEAGHWAAMRAFGYRDTSVFFVPFLGAAAAGRKEDAPLWQEMIVLHAGPLPGIALGAALAWRVPGFVASEAGTELVTMLLFLNLFNLFPILPLDGGRIVDRLLFGRRPRAAVAFALLGIAGLAALAYAAGDPVLGAFALLFAFGLPTHYRVARLGIRVRAAQPRDARERVRAAFAALPAGAFARRLGLVQALETSWAERPAGRLARLAWLGAYTFCLVGGGVGATLALAWPMWSASPWLDPAGAEPVACSAPAPADSLAALSPDESRERYALVLCRAEPEPSAALAAELRQFEAAQALGLCLRPPWRLQELEASERARAEAARAALVALADADPAGAQDTELARLYERIASGADADGSALATLEARLGGCTEADGDSLLGIDDADGVVRFAFASDALHASVPLATAHACARGCRVELRTARFAE